jgi:DNA-binding NarL/FixJ family response regulator
VLILSVDDDRVFRQELKRLLEGTREVHVVEAEDGEDGLRLARELRPDVVLMDIAMPRLNGLEATRQIKAAQPETKVIVLTVHDEAPYRKAARESGADAFLAKKTVVGELIPAIGSLVPRFPAKSEGDNS